MAVNTDLKDIKITLQNGYEMSTMTSKSTVSEILEENNIILNEDQKTIPDLDSEISSGDTIKITDKSYNEVQIAKISEEGIETSLNQLLENYAPITEKIVVEQVAIPYETITKNTTGTSTETTNKVVVMGKKTFLSLPRKPLPNRINIVLSNNDNFFYSCCSIPANYRYYVPISLCDVCKR